MTSAPNLGHQHLHHPAAGRDVRTQAQASFDCYIKPIEVRNALAFVLTNDPRTFFAHQSNLAEDGILYPVVEGVLDQYKAVYDSTKAPLVHLDLQGQEPGADPNGPLGERPKRCHRLR